MCFSVSLALTMPNFIAYLFDVYSCEETFKTVQIHVKIASIYVFSNHMPSTHEHIKGITLKFSLAKRTENTQERVEFFPHEVQRPSRESR